MKKIFNIKIVDKKISSYIHKCNILGIILCLFSFLFTYYYFQILKKDILTLGLFLFEAGLSIVAGGYMSAIIINQEKS